MGAGRDRRKKAKERKDGPAAGKGAVKTARKTERNADKAERRDARRAAGDEDDLDAMFAQFELAQKGAKEVVVEADCAPPSARVNASFLPHVAGRTTEIILFGGECIDPISGKVQTFNDLYRYHPDKDKWSRVVTLSSPAPRCAHQAVIHKGCMYVFGGEITSPNQERFHHYKELWRLDLSTWEWDQIPQKGSSCPSARSGHRMAVHKGRVIMFGGFFDTGKDVRYFNEGWLLSLEDLKWRGPFVPSAGQMWPSARSGCGIAVHEDKLFVYGGYSKEVDSADAEIEHGKACEDMWALDLTKLAWDKVKRAGMAPGARSSFAMIPFKNRAYVFGGVSDNECRGGEDLSSEFHNDLYVFNFDKQRWFAAEMRLPKKGSGATADAAPSGAASCAADDAGPAPMDVDGGGGSAVQAADDRLSALLAAGNDRSSAIYRAVVKIQANFRGYVVRKAYKTYKLGGAISELLYSPASYGLDMSVANMPKPKGRINAQVAVVGNHAFLFGGIVEVGEKEITLDDIWLLDLSKMDGWQLVKENTGGEEVFRRAAAAGMSSEQYSDGPSSDEGD